MTRAKWSDSVKTLACFSLPLYWYSSHGEKAWPLTIPRLHLKSFYCERVTVMMNSLVTSPEILRNGLIGPVWSQCLPLDLFGHGVEVSIKAMWFE